MLKQALRSRQRTRLAYFYSSHTGYFTLLLLISCAILFLFAMSTNVQSSPTCKTVQPVFARGSGEPLGAKHYQRFSAQLRTRINSSIANETYELGAGWPEYNYRYQLYPAVKVSGTSTFTTGLGAKMSDGEALSYGRSVQAGVFELIQFISAQSAKCPNTKYILGGYSQGAQVIGETLYHLPSSYTNRIVFVALFGDPKLHLPEGEGIWPPACRGKGFSHWRRDVPNCHTDNGTLGARDPYIPLTYAGKVGLWCNAKDWICGSTKNPLNSSGHEDYSTVNGPIDKAAREAAIKLASLLPATNRQYINTGLFVNDGSQARKNISYVWQVNASTQSLYWHAKTSLLTSAQRIWLQDGRVALAPYLDLTQGSFSWVSPSIGIDRPASPNRGLFPINDNLHFTDRLEYYSYQPHTNTPGSEFLLVAATNMDLLPWQHGTDKATIFIAEQINLESGRLRYLESEKKWVPIRDYLARRAIEIDPVNLYFILGNTGSTENAEYLADATGGKVITYDPNDPSSIETAIQQASSEVLERPAVVLGSDTYEAYNGEPIVIDASGSYATSGEIVRYDWDYDADGTWDDSSVQPHAAHLYPDNFNGIAHIKATDSAGRIGTMTVNITMVPPSDTHALNIPFIEGMTYEIVETANTTSSILLSWKTPGPAYNVMLNIDGRPTGYIEDRDQTSLIITDFRRDEDRTISLQAFDQHNNLGERRSVTIPAIPALSTDKGQALMSTRIGVNPLTPHPALLSHQSKPVSPSDNTPFNHSFGAAAPPTHIPPANDNNERNTTTAILIAIAVATVVFTAGGIAILRKKSSPYRHKNAK